MNGVVSAHYPTNGSRLGRAVDYIKSIEANKPRRKQMQWYPIETAPKGVTGWSFMLLLHGHDEDKTTSMGMRWGDKFYAAGIFFCIGQQKKFEFREHEVIPTHWMPLPQTQVE